MNSKPLYVIDKQKDKCEELLFKNHISGELNTHKMNAYCHIDHIASVLQFSSKLNECGSYKVYNI